MRVKSLAQPVEGKLMWKIRRFRIGMAGQSTNCPSCSSSKVRRSRRKGVFEKGFLKIFAVYPYRCEECDERYYRIGPRREPPEQLRMLPSETPRALEG
jgi:hypothetical protein